MPRPQGHRTKPSPRLDPREAVASYQQALTELQHRGPDAFVRTVLTCDEDRSVGHATLAASLLAAPSLSPERRALGLELLAEAFARAGHMTFVAATLRNAFAPWVNSAYEHDRLEAVFTDLLAARGCGQAVVDRFHMLLHGSDRGKVFGIGLNKTGTTSLLASLLDLGLLVAPQPEFEPLYRDWVARRFDRIVKQSRHYQAFQDVPFSLPFTFQALDQAFPEARFILTVRGSADEWYESLLRFHRKLIFGGGEPSWEALKRFHYIYPEYLYETSVWTWRWNEFGLYDRTRATDLYKLHNDCVAEYFHTRPDKLLVLNLAEPDAYDGFCRFLGLEPEGTGFPQLNTSR